MNFYLEAASIIDQLESKKGSIKGLLGTLPEKSRKRTAALVIETLKCDKLVLVDVIEASPLLTQERRIIPSKTLALLLVHDLLFGRGIEASDGPIKQAILRHKTRLQSELVKIKVKRGVKSNEELAQPEDSRVSQIPRYVRVNTLLWSTEEAIESFRLRDFTFGNDPLLSAKFFSRDVHIPDLLAFNPSIQFHEDPHYLSGKLILQDKASCFPAFILAPEPLESVRVIDATAAPGNKTSHLSALMKNKGKLFAFEKDRRRFKTLESMLGKAGCQNVVCFNSDFLTINPQDPKYASVTHILLDPSCSGSGIVNRLDHLTEHEGTDLAERLQKLSSFQVSIILHSMRFPSVQKIVYSTCSIHKEENEGVVLQILGSTEPHATKFTLAPRSQVLPEWQRRGIPTVFDSIELSDCVIRCNPGEDGTNGFFVACFIPRVDQDENTRKRKRPEGYHEEGKHKPQKKKKKRKKNNSTVENPSVANS